MYCPKCGSQSADDVKFCSNCGFDIDAFKGRSQTAAASTVREQMTFSEAISVCMKKYVTFNGRASRAEYWWFFLFFFILNAVATLVDSSEALSGLISLVLFLPHLAVYVRRLHDTNHSGWWVLIAFTVIGLIPLFIWLVQIGDPLENGYGQPV